jgi:hypothetical protein
VNETRAAQHSPLSLIWMPFCSFPSTVFTRDIRHSAIHPTRTHGTWYQSAEHAAVTWPEPEKNPPHTSARTYMHWPDDPSKILIVGLYREVTNTWPRRQKRHRPKHTRIPSHHVGCLYLCWSEAFADCDGAVDLLQSPYRIASRVYSFFGCSSYPVEVPPSGLGGVLRWEPAMLRPCIRDFLQGQDR